MLPRIESYQVSVERLPGGKTGLLTHDVKTVGSGTCAERVHVYAVDTGLLKQMLDLERQAAAEVGQRAGEAMDTGDLIVRYPPVTPGTGGQDIPTDDDQVYR